MKQSEHKPSESPINPPENAQPSSQNSSKPTPQIPSELKQPYYTFSFDSYYSTHYKTHKKNYLNKLKIRGKIFAIAGLTVFIVGNIYPLMMWFEYDINVRKPRVSEYLLNRLN